MKGWKTWTGAAIMAASTALFELGFIELSEAFRTFAFALLAIGLGHKLEKLKK
jgi:hypothetical protein